MYMYLCLYKYVYVYICMEVCIMCVCMYFEMFGIFYYFSYNQVSYRGRLFNPFTEEGIFYRVETPYARACAVISALLERTINQAFTIYIFTDNILSLLLLLPYVYVDF